MEGVKHGGDRQDLHEKIRVLSMQAGENVKVRGLKNNLLELIIEDGSFGITEDDISRIMNPELYIGRAPQQVEEYITNVVNPMLDANKELLTIGQVDLKV